ncbi:alanine racemase-like [Haliotis cracherodii]|uniref:alanine racemase-like n=1 Tax=Haliotis cracherodii TaxID=6455 RepID=UPI0039EC5AB2
MRSTMSHNGVMKAPPHGAEMYLRAGRSTYLRINFDVLYNNISILKQRCSPHTDVIAVVKANAYGHGSVEISRYLESRGIGHFAVATPEEGAQLRQAGIKGHIQILGNAVEEDIPTLVKYRLTPTVAELKFLQEWSRAVTADPVSSNNAGNDTISSNKVTDSHALQERVRKRHQLVLKIDTGMSRNGCQTQDFPSLIQFCQTQGLTVHSVMTHFSQAWDNPHFTKQQLNTLMTLVEPLRTSGVKVHVANSAAIIRGFGTQLDFIRPGICMYGLPPDASTETAELVESLGLRPVLSWRARPTLIKQLPQRRVVGYDNTYMTRGTETIATFSLGYADGYNRLMSDRGAVSLDEDDVRCPVVGRVSMDAITVRLDQPRPSPTTFNIITDDFTSPNSVTKMAAILGTIPYEVTTSLAARLPRVFVSGGHIVAVTKSLMTDER